MGKVLLFFCSSLRQLSDYLIKTSVLLYNFPKYEDYDCYFKCRTHDLKCIIDLHAAPGSQNGMEHSASRDGSVDWPTPDYISQTLDVIDFLSARYMVLSWLIIN